MLANANKDYSVNWNFIEDSLISYRKKYAKIDILLNPEYYPFVKSLINTIEEGKHFDIILPFLRKTTNFPSTKITPLALPPGTKWENIIIITI